jgi:polyphosphate kinase
MNALTDDRLASSLVAAAKQGVKVQLIVRGACILPAEIPGMTDNIEVRSVIGRFLEHSRVFYFCAGTEEALYLSSADWMNRNMLRRVELAWPVRVIDECLNLYLNDNTDAWVLQPDASYQRLQPPARRGKRSAQAQLMARYSGKP